MATRGHNAGRALSTHILKFDRSDLRARLRPSDRDKVDSTRRDARVARRPGVRARVERPRSEVRPVGLSKRSVSRGVAQFLRRRVEKK
jgi:hypothetical protein